MVYLDHAATTDLRPEAREAWLHASALTGNASSVHRDGQAARRLLEEAREQVAEALNCDPIEVVFVSGGTEAVNLALKGLWWSRADGSSRIVLPDAEHHATIDAVEWLVRTQAAQLRRVPVTAYGRIDPAEFAAALSGSAVATAVVANNEVGTINDAAALAAAAAAAAVPLHLDAVGAVGWVPVRFAQWRGAASGRTGLVALSVSGHKIGAPVGTGVLVVSRHASPESLLHGGGQQRGLRAGTQDVAGAAAFAAAVTAAARDRARDASRLRGLRDRLVSAVVAAAPDALLLGDPEERLAGNAHFLFPGALGESMLFLLDQAGISVSTGSACQAGVTEPSHVVMALGRSEVDARSVLRFSLGRSTSEADVDEAAAAAAAAYATVVGRARPTSPSAL